VRAQWKKDTNVIHLTDFGAGSYGRGSANEVTIRSVAAKALSQPFQCRFMARLAGFSQSGSILEFGTSLGIMAAYLKKGAPTAALTTVEGDPVIAALARQTLDTTGLKDVQILNTPFGEYLQTIAHQPTAFDLVFLDGHHLSSPLLSYYGKLKKYFSTKTIVVVDDIYWSADMQSGWQQLIRMPEVTQSVDCFHFGLLFFSADFLQKEHHRIRIPLSA
jgi:predicted O-methyltransferase YrrM